MAKSRRTKVAARGKLAFEGAEPGKVTYVDEQPGDVSAAQKRTAKKLAAVVTAYLKAAEELLAGRYSHLREQTPRYLSHPGNVYIFLCSDGLVIRYETSEAKESRIFSGVSNENISTIARQISQNLVNCCRDASEFGALGPSGVELKLLAFDPHGNTTRELVAGNISFNAVVARPAQMPIPPQKPFCLLSILNRVEIGIVGEAPEADAERAKRFVTRSVVRLPVGWECLEVFPYFDASQWKPEYSPVWAERDLLSWVVAHQQHEAHYNALDVRAAVRNEYARLLAEFKSLLDSNPEREQLLQDFLQANPQFLCPTHIKMWPKLPFGANVSDFVFHTASNDYLLVEIERSTHRLFRKDGHPTAELTTAQSQVMDWRRYIEDNLSTVRQELGLKEISSNADGLVVIGRSKTLSDKERRKLRAMSSNNPKLKVMTYDDVYDSAKAVIENIFGPIWDVGSETRIYFPQ